MALVDFSSVEGTLAELFEDSISNQINRAVVLAQLLDVGPGTGKNIQWPVRTGTATPTTAVIADGADVSTFNNDTKQPAVLQFGTYHDAFSLTGKAMAAARAAGNPMELAMLLVDELGDSVERLARAIAADVYLGTGAANTIHGLLDGSVPAIGATGTYAGIDRSSVALWQGTEIDAAGSSLSYNLIRQLRREIYVKSGEKPDLFLCDPVQHEKYGLLFQSERRYMTKLNLRGQVINLEGGYQTLEMDGIPVVEDSQCPSGVFIAINTRHVKLAQLADSADAMNRAMGKITLGGTPEEQYGMAKTKLTARIQQLAITGDAFKFALYCYPQLQVKRPNACGYLKNLAI